MTDHQRGTYAAAGMAAALLLIGWCEACGRTIGTKTPNDEEP